MFNINNLKEDIEDNRYKAKIRYLMSKHDIDLDKLIKLIKSMTIYLDYDEVLVDLNKAWLKYYNQENQTDFKYTDIDKFYWWDNKPKGLDFLLKNPDCYKEVEVKENVELFFENCHFFVRLFGKMRSVLMT